MPVAQYRVGRPDGKPDAFIATTCGSGRPCGNYTMAIADTMTYLAQNDLSADYWLHCGDCHVDDARNFMVRQFLMSDAPVLLFIDDDVGFDAKNVGRLISADGDVVGGCYPLKQDNEEYPVRIQADKEFLQAREDGLLEVEGVPTGFMAIKRHVLEAMAEKRKYLSYRQKGFPTGPEHPVIFERATTERHRWSGDLNFCREVRGLGFKIFVDPEMHFTHEGLKRWHGHLGNWLRKMNNIPDPLFAESMQKIIDGDVSEEVFNNLWRGYGNPFAAGAPMCKQLYEEVPKVQGDILECGSGLTTLVMAAAVQRTGQTIHTLEHDYEWFRRMRGMIQQYAMRPVKLYYVPIEEHKLDGVTIPWYEIREELPKEFGLVVVDGPQRSISRKGLFELIGDRIEKADWYVDDVDDKSQVAMLEKYSQGQRNIERLGGPRPLREYAVVKKAA